MRISARHQAIAPAKSGETTRLATRNHAQHVQRARSHYEQHYSQAAFAQALATIVGDAPVAAPAAAARAAQAALLKQA